MKLFKQGLLVASIALSLPSIACTVNGDEGFVPENNLKISAHAKRVGGITEEQFNAIIDKYETL